MTSTQSIIARGIDFTATVKEDISERFKRGIDFTARLPNVSLNQIKLSLYMPAVVTGGATGLFVGEVVSKAVMRLAYSPFYDTAPSGFAYASLAVATGIGALDSLSKKNWLKHIPAIANKRNEGDTLMRTDILEKSRALFALAAIAGCVAGPMLHSPKIIKPVVGKNTLRALPNTIINFDGFELRGPIVPEGTPAAQEPTHQQPPVWEPKRAKTIRASFPALPARYRLGLAS